MVPTLLQLQPRVLWIVWLARERQRDRESSAGAGCRVYGVVEGGGCRVEGGGKTLNALMTFHQLESALRLRLCISLLVTVASEVGDLQREWN